MSNKRPVADKRPVVYGRTREDLLEHVEEIAPYYTNKWSPEAEGAGRAMLELFSEMVADVTGRLNRVPEKHRIAFYDELGFARKPPQPARLPLTVTLMEDIEENVSIRSGTQATAPTEGDEPEQVFEIPPGEGFEATPATLTRIYSVDPDNDRIFEHQATLESGGESRLFGGQNLQEHALHVGHVDLFDLSAGAVIWVVWTTSMSVSELTWEYYEERNGDPEGEHWHSLTKVGDWNVNGGTVTALQLPNDEKEIEVTETELGGVESRWIRCLPKPSAPEGLLDLEVSDMHLLVAPKPESGGDALTSSGRGAPSHRGVQPDLLLSNNVPLPESSEESIRPFGAVAQPGDTFYIASDDAFSKRETTVSLGFVVEDGPEPFDVSWQYWNGKGWAALDIAEYNGHSNGAADWKSMDEEGRKRRSMSSSGGLRFDIPSDLTSTEVAGFESHWIKVQVLQEQQGPLESQGMWDGNLPGYKWTLLTESMRAPAITNLRIRYGDELASLETATSVLETAENKNPPKRLISGNNLIYETHPVGEDLRRFRPFKPLTEEAQTIYFGFDAPLRDGPIPLFVSQTDHDYPKGFHPHIRWEYAETTTGDSWTRPNVRDRTKSLTQRGIVRLSLPEPTASSSRFGEELHWIRATVTGEPFDVPPHVESIQSFLQMAAVPISWPSYLRATNWFGFERGVTGSNESTMDRSKSVCLEPCEGAARLQTEPPAGAPTRDSPTLRGVYLNTTWAENVRTITHELLGSSDGRPGQTFVVSAPPVTDASIWVDERPVRSDAELRELAATQPNDVEEVTDADGRPLAFWVRWQEVPDLLVSGPDDRHYTLNRFKGRISFGDGVEGAIPPRDQNNVRATYRTGGGAGGNVAAGEIVELTMGLDLVDTVTNPEAADGGANAESLDSVLARAPKQLRDRDRAVTKADFERVAMAVSRKLARTRCIPRMDESGDHRLGWVTVLIVPMSRDRQPTPSAELLDRVRAALEARAPATLVAPTRRLVVRGPSYVEVSVVTRLITRNAESVSVLQEDAVKAISAFLHPLTGGSQGDGWEFGHLPCASDFYPLLEGVEGVDHVDELSVTFEGVGTEDRTTIGDGDPEPTVAPDALVFSGIHSARVRLTPELTATRGP